MFSGFTYHQKTGGEHMEHDRLCEYQDLCEECHAEPEMAEKRKECNGRNCKKCGVYWAFRDGYFGLDE